MLLYRSKSDCRSTPDHEVEFRRLQLQRWFGWLALLPLGFGIVLYMRYVHRLRIRHHRKVRRRFYELTKHSKRFMICANHLTMVDSVILLWAFRSIPQYCLDYRLFSWNIPAFENFSDRFSWRIITFLTKCIPIERKGTKSHIDSVLHKLTRLLNDGDVCTIFPEGTRSRTGRVELSNATYGVGSVLNNVKDCDVLCVYLRGDSQESYSNFPSKGESFNIEIELITPKSDNVGLRAVRDISMQILEKIKEMEERYFEEQRTS
ncbi:MAG: 1-acyl-sn-glycerol-3-phosphate acyltransferase [Bdellovibrionales bacterium]|nr:1-acyl-sn-glycerol-3-phosphate acyltransferase [Bdellovibrionales bacterium]